MEILQIQKILQSHYTRDKWIKLLGDIFKNIKIFNTPQVLSSNTDNAKQVSYFGSIELNDLKKIGLYEIEVSDKTVIDRNRVALREIAVKYIDNDINNAAFVFYYHKSKEDFRFSFIAKSSEFTKDGEYLRFETHPKRYTYILGPSENCKTAALRFERLLKRSELINISDLIEAFNVDKLTKDFFKEYKLHFNKFVSFLIESSYKDSVFKNTFVDESDLQINKRIREFIKLLLGRIIFLYFLQRKGWLGCSKNSRTWLDGDKDFLNSLYSSLEKKDKFYSEVLTELFFNSLNNIESDIFSITNTRVPYLNGGLFENYFPESNHIDFPENYFNELIEFFNRYNFTIDENSPDDHTVGIDPEMLGHIFENLLEDNREKGSYYTPQEIVHYMCQESLFQYLRNIFSTHSTNNIEKSISNFVRYKNLDDFIISNARNIDSNLNDIKICDPAIGSGAFPMGLLKEIYALKLYLFPHLNSNQDFNHSAVKRKIIENSIYGVDIDSGAVDIARLRFWLALIVDAEYPSPLPNLDFKIMQGDSLLESFEQIDLSNIANISSDYRIIEPEKDLFGRINDGQLKITFLKSDYLSTLQTSIKSYFSEKDPVIKQSIMNDINKIIHNILDLNIELREKQIDRRLAEAGDLYKKNKTLLKEIESLKKTKEKLLIAKTYLQKINSTDEKPFFLWRLYFKDVFDKGGFDIVIGNPPYRQLQKDGGKLAKLYENEKYKTFSRSGDIYSLFYEKGLQILKDQGFLIFITSNKWMRTTYGRLTRKFFAENNPIILLDFGNVQNFETATVDTCITVLQKDVNDNLTLVSRFNKNYKRNSLIYSYILENNGILKTLDKGGSSWTVKNKGKDEVKIKSFIEDQGIPLINWNIQINYGIKTGFNRAFIIPSDIKNTLINDDPKNKEVIKPLLRGKDIKIYFPDFKDKWLINIHNGYFDTKLNKKIPPIEISHYPIIKKYLDNYLDNIVARQDQGITPYHLRSCTYLEEFEKDKIIYPNMTKYLPFVFDAENYYTNQKCFILTGESLKYLTAVLNSKVFKFAFRDYFPELQGGTRELSKVYFEKIPIKKIDVNNQKPFNNIVDHISFLKKSDSNESKDMVVFFEKLIDGMIYEIYFSKIISESNRNIINHINELKYFSKQTSSENKYSIIKSNFKLLATKDHPVRNNLFYLSSIKEIKIIEKDYVENQ